MKKMISFLLCATLCLTSLPLSTFAADTPVGNVPGVPETGDIWDGTTSKPTKLVQIDDVYYYEITKCSELAYIAETGGEWLTYNYILGSNLILNKEDVDLSSRIQWDSIDYFSGIFDGANYIISGLYYNSEYASRVGLFGTTDGAKIKNVTLVDATIAGHVCIGGIVGEAESTTIQNCHFSGDIKGSNYVGGICGEYTYGTLSNCTNYGTITANKYVGGICGYTYAKIEDCDNFGNIGCSDVGIAERTGGIVGHGATVEKCNNYGDVTGGERVGGVTGHSTSEMLSSKNYGNVTGVDLVGGISGCTYYGGNACKISGSINYGDVIGENHVGGIVGKDGLVYTSCNIGQVYGTTNVGGIAGFNSGLIRNSYNTGSVKGINCVGGLCGDVSSCDLATSYNAGQVVGEEEVGAIVGSDDIIWGDSTVKNVYYLQTDMVNTGLLGSSFETEIDGMVALDVDEMKEKVSFAEFNFTGTWSIDEKVNGGYPYLQWQENDLSDIIVNGVQISKVAIVLAEGDHAYLTATVSPTNASDQSITWTTSDSSVAAISTAGKVTAIAPGTAIITVTTKDGGHAATCSVTVTDRKSEEYKINSITVRDSSGETLTTIPIGSFLASVSITNLVSEGDTLVFLAAYTGEGRYKGLMWVSIRDLPVGATIEVTLPVDNIDGTIAQLKAFSIASFSNLVPLGSAVSFPAQ